jgi:hypothetical protein
MTRDAMEFTPVDLTAWTLVAGSPVVIEERILSHDDAAGRTTRMTRFPPGCDTTANGEQIHAFWEEVYIVSGELVDLRLQETFAAGSYACRPPGMPHGPWLAPRGCVTFEVRYRLETI